MSAMWERKLELAKALKQESSQETDDREAGVAWNTEGKRGRRGSVDNQEPVGSSKGLPLLSVGIGAMQDIEERTVRVWDVVEIDQTYDSLADTLWRSKCDDSSHASFIYSLANRKHLY